MDASLLPSPWVRRGSGDTVTTPALGAQESRLRGNDGGWIGHGGQPLAVALGEVGVRGYSHDAGILGLRIPAVMVPMQSMRRE